MKLVKLVESEGKSESIHGLVGKPEKRTPLRKLTVDGRVKKWILNRVRW